MSYHQARDREGLTHNSIVGQAECFTQKSYLIFEESSQRLQQFEGHFFRQPTHIVVTFDQSRGISGNGNAFNDIGVSCPLGKKISVGDAAGGIVEYFNK